MKNVLLKCVLGCLLASTLAHLPARASGDSVELSGGLSFLSAIGSVYVVDGSLETVRGSANTVVEGVQRVGQTVHVVLKNLGDGSRTTLRLSGQAAGNLSLGVGQSVVVTATASGHVLSAAGAIIAFLPNELGKSLLHHSRTGA